MAYSRLRGPGMAAAQAEGDMVAAGGEGRGGHATLGVCRHLVVRVRLAGCRQLYCAVSAM